MDDAMWNECRERRKAVLDGLAKDLEQRSKSAPVSSLSSVFFPRYPHDLQTDDKIPITSLGSTQAMV